MLKSGGGGDNPSSVSKRSSVVETRQLYSILSMDDDLDSDTSEED